jgi:hypothetical protein
MWGILIGIIEKKIMSTAGKKKKKGGKIFQILINFCKKKCDFIKAEFVLNEIYFKF